MSHSKFPYGSVFYGSAFTTHRKSSPCYSFTHEIIPLKQLLPLVCTTLFPSSHTRSLHIMMKPRKLWVTVLLGIQYRLSTRVLQDRTAIHLKLRSYILGLTSVQWLATVHSSAFFFFRSSYLFSSSNISSFSYIGPQIISTSIFYNNFEDQLDIVILLAVQESLLCAKEPIKLCL